MKLVSVDDYELFISENCPVDESLSYEEWRSTRDAIEQQLSKHGTNDIGGTGNGDFHVGYDWFKSRTIHTMFGSRTMVKQKVLRAIMTTIGKRPHRYCVTIVGDYPQVSLLWHIALTHDKSVIAFGPTYETRLRDSATDPEITKWCQVLDGLYKGQPNQAL